MKRRVVRILRPLAAVCLSALLVAALFPADLFAEEVTGQTEQQPSRSWYNDVPEQAFYREALVYLTLLGAIGPNEAGGFAPNQPVTRGEFAVWLARSLGLAPVHESVFTDVPGDSAAAPYIHALHKAEVIQGYLDGTFRGDRPITRAEAAQILAVLTGKPGSPRHAAGFPDVGESDWFAGAVGTLANLRVISGKTDGHFAPADKLTRGEAALLLYRLLFDANRIEDLDGEKVTINGHAYRWDESLAGLFREINRDALTGATIWFENDGDTILSVTKLELVTGGMSATDKPAFLDGGGAVIDGSLYVTADYVIIADLHVKQNLIVTGLSRDAILLSNTIVEGYTILTPGAEGTGDRQYPFLYNKTVFGNGLMIARNAAIVNLEEGSVPVRPSGTANVVRKAEKPVSIASLNAFDTDWYLKRNPEIVEAIQLGLLSAMEQFLLYGNHEPPSLDDIRNFSLSPGPDSITKAALLLEAIQMPEFNAYDHFLQFGSAEERIPEFSFLPSNFDLRDVLEQGMLDSFEHLLLNGQPPSGPAHSLTDEIESTMAPVVSPVMQFLDYLTDSPSLPSILLSDIFSSPTPSIDITLPEWSVEQRDFNFILPPFLQPPSDQESEWSAPDLPEILEELQTLKDLLPPSDQVPEWLLPNLPEILENMQTLEDLLQTSEPDSDQEMPDPATGSETGPSSDPSDGLPVAISLHFVGSAQINILGNTTLDIIDTSDDSSRLIINGEAETLEIHVASPGQENLLELEINGQVGKIVLSGEYEGDIVLSGSGNVGEIETSGSDTEDTMNVRVEGDLEVRTLNGRQVIPTESEPPAPPSPPSHPSVTQAVYDAYADYAEFTIRARNAAKLYYYALHESADEPSAGLVKELALSVSEPGEPFGQAAVSGGQAVFAVGGLAESEGYVLYVVAEAPNGKLSGVYRFPFSTDSLKILDVTYTETEDGGIRFFATMNSLASRIAYFLLTNDPAADYEEGHVKEFAYSGCDMDGYDCGGRENPVGSDTIEIHIAFVEPGSWRFFVTVEGNVLAPVYRVDFEKN